MQEKTSLERALEVYFDLVRKEDVEKEIKELLSKELLRKEDNVIIHGIINNKTYIKKAVESHDLEMTRLLYIHGAFLSNELFKIAFDNKDIDILIFLIENGVNLNEKIEYDKGKEYPLVYVIKKYKDEYYEVVEKMLQNGADPNIDFSILNYIIREYYNLRKTGKALFNLLLEYNAPFDTTNGTSIYFAAHYLSTNDFKKIIPNGYEYIQAFMGAAGGNPDVLKYLFQHNSNNSMVFSVLMDLISKNSLSPVTLKIILDLGLSYLQLKFAIKCLRYNKSNYTKRNYVSCMKMLKNAKKIERN